MQVTSFRVRWRRAHTQAYVTEPKTRRKGARCALMLRLDNKKARINRAFFVVVEIRGFEPLTYALRTHRSTN